MMIEHPPVPLIVLLASLASVVACGGGGGGGSSSDPVVDVPVTPDPDPVDPEPVDPEPESSCEVLTRTDLVSDLHGGDTSYNRAYWAEQARAIMTQHWVDPEELYAEIPDIEQCIAGSVSDETQQQILTFMNHARAIHGLEPLAYRPEYDGETAAAALLIAARGDFYSTDINYYDRCQSAEAEEGLRDSALRWGRWEFEDSLPELASETLNPVHSLTHWLSTYEVPEPLITPVPPLDPNFIRPLLLDPALAATSYGQAGPAAALSCKENGALPIYPSPISPEIDFIAYPYERFPYFMAPDYSWDIQLRSSSDMSDAVVCVTNIDTGELIPVQNQRTMNTRGYLRWNIFAQADTHYQVSIHNIGIAESGQMSTISYPVFIDYSSIAYVNAPLEDSDVQTGSELTGKLSSLDDVDTFQIALSGDVELKSTRVSGENIEIAVFSPEGDLLGVAVVDTPEDFIDDVIEAEPLLQLPGLPSDTYSVRISLPQSLYSLPDLNTDYVVEVSSE